MGLSLKKSSRAASKDDWFKSHSQLHSHFKEEVMTFLVRLCGFPAGPIFPNIIGSRAEHLPEDYPTGRWP